MMGSNKMILNSATMVQMVNEYLAKRWLSPPKATAFKSLDTYEGTFEVAIEGCPETKTEPAGG